MVLTVLKSLSLQKQSAYLIVRHCQKPSHPRFVLFYSTTSVQQHGCLWGERRHPWERTKHSERLARQHRRSQDEPTMAAFESDHLEQVHVFILLLCLLQWKDIMRWALLAKFVVFRDQERSSAMCTPRNVLSTCLTVVAEGRTVCPACSHSEVVR